MANPSAVLVSKHVSTDVALVSLTDRLLELLSTLAPDYPTLDTDKFRNALDHWRDNLRRETQGEGLVALITRVVDECEKFFRRARTAEGEREAEFGEIVGVLREVLGTLRGGSETFDQGFEQSASEFARIAGIDDIRELRRALAQEVDTLRQLVAERKAREDTALKTLNQRVEKLEANLKEAQEEASTDGLTGLANRRTFDRNFARFMARAAKGDFRFTLAMVDIDDFKRINDDHGHQVGDRVIMCVGSLLAGHVRSSDLVARYGGEEFAVLLGQIGLAQAKPRLKALIDSLAKSYRYELRGEPRSVTFTFSIGAAEYTDGDSAEDIIRRADEALYTAKRKGKHRLEISGQTFLKRLLG
jgi:diguanylate cyclase